MFRCTGIVFRQHHPLCLLKRSKMKCKTQTEIDTLFKQSTFIPDPNNANRLQITYDLDAAESLIHIEKIVHALIEKKDEPLYVVENRRRGLKCIKFTSFGYDLMHAICRGTNRSLSHFPIHDFNPYIKVFFDTIKDGVLADQIISNGLLRSDNCVCCDEAQHQQFLLIEDGIKTLIDTIRQEVKGPGFRRLVYSQRRVSKKNYKGLVSYIDSLFSRYDRLLVLRVDFAYHMGNTITQPCEISSKYQEAKADFHHFLNNTKSNGLFKHLIGYVWKLEYGTEKGFHYHVLFFFNGAKIRKDENLAMLIGEYWKNNITQGRGLYYNCNANKHQYSQLGIGLIKYSDSALRVGLYKTASYLVKVDHYARLLSPDNSRTFGRSEIVKPKQDGRGRPRTYSSEGNLKVSSA